MANRQAIIEFLTQRLEDINGFHKICYTDIELTEREVAEHIVDYFWDRPNFTDYWKEDLQYDHHYQACIYFVISHWLIYKCWEKLLNLREDENNPLSKKINGLTGMRFPNNEFAIVNKYNYFDALKIQVINYTGDIMDILVYPDTTNMKHKIANYRFGDRFSTWYQLDEHQLSKIEYFVYNPNKNRLTPVSADKLWYEIEDTIKKCS